MKFRGYRFGVEWIAENDEPGSEDALNVEKVRDQVAVEFLADLCSKTPDEVAEAIVKYRKTHAGDQQ